MDIGLLIIIIAFAVGGTFGMFIKLSMAKKEKLGKKLSKKQKRELENEKNRKI